MPLAAPRSAYACRAGRHLRRAAQAKRGTIRRAVEKADPHEGLRGVVARKSRRNSLKTLKTGSEVAAPPAHRAAEAALPDGRPYG
jgi:hypothetical protein